MNTVKKIITIIAIAILIVGAVVLLRTPQEDATVSTNEEKELRIGYIIYPPLLMQDPATGELSGISYDIVEAAAEDLGYTTNWAEEVGWGTALEGLNTNRYNILGTQMWPNDSRRAVARFSTPPMDSVMYPYVRIDDDRFDSGHLAAINSSEFTISTLDGEMTSFIAAEDYPEANVQALPQLASFAEVFLNIVLGKADLTFAEPSTAEDFLSSNPNTLTQLGDEPVRVFGNSFAFDKEEDELLAQWNEAIQNMIDEDAVAPILERHGALSHYVIQ